MITDMRLTSESKGSSATSDHSRSSPLSRSRFQLKREAKTWIAISVGSPRACHCPSFSTTVARLASEATFRNSFRLLWLRWNISSTFRICPHASPPILKSSLRGERSS